MYDSRAADSFEQRGARKRLNKSARQREAKRLKALPEEDCAEAYDRVLVDADCTTDGSHAHVQKMVDKGTSVANVATERCASLIELQAALLRNGFGRLRNGGVLVYGACSLTKAQNENIIGPFYGTSRRARSRSLEAPPVAVAGNIPGTVRFPAGGETSGLFVARLEKICLNHSPRLCLSPPTYVRGIWLLSKIRVTNRGEDHERPSSILCGTDAVKVAWEELKMMETESRRWRIFVYRKDAAIRDPSPTPFGRR